MDAERRTDAIVLGVAAEVDDEAGKDEANDEEDLEPTHGVLDLAVDTRAEEVDGDREEQEALGGCKWGQDEAERSAAASAERHTVMTPASLTVVISVQ